MKKTTSLLAALTLISGCATQSEPTNALPASNPVEAVTPIFQDQKLFAVIEKIDGDQLRLRMLHSVVSRGASTILFVGDEIQATVSPLGLGETRQRTCVTAIHGQEGTGKLVPGSESELMVPGCIAQLRDFRGTYGLSPEQITIDTVTTIFLNGDLIFERSGAAGPAARPKPIASLPAQSPTAAVTPIPLDETLFAVVEKVDGDQLHLHMLHSVMSHDATTILFVGDEIQAIALPLPPEGTRQRVCVTAIRGQEGVGKIVPGSEISTKKPACQMGELHDFRGYLGLSPEQIAIDTVTRIRLNGDLAFESLE